MIAEQYTLIHHVKGPALRAWREGLGISLRRLAKKLDISPTYLSRLETAEKTRIGSKLADRIRALSALESPK